MSNDNPLKPLKSITIKTEEDSVNRFNNLREAVGISTSGQFFTELLDRYEQPQRIGDRTRELEEQLQQLQTKYDGEKAINEQLNSQLEALRHQNEELQGTANSNAEEANRLQLEHERQLAELAPKENQVLISFTPDNLRVLDLVCTRESKRRGQQWSRSHVINYFINARFVRGLLNGDLQSIPDSELRRMGVSLKNPGKEEFDL